MRAARVTSGRPLRSRSRGESGRVEAPWGRPGRRPLGPAGLRIRGISLAAAVRRELVHTTQPDRRRLVSRSLRTIFMKSWASIRLQPADADEGEAVGAALFADLGFGDAFHGSSLRSESGAF